MATWTAAINNMIRERQLADRVGSPLTLDATVEDSVAIAAVNAIAADFVQGRYNGGASAPTMLSSSYATGAASEEELAALVRAMIQTKLDSDDEDVTETAGAQYDGHGGSEPSLAEAKAEAEADWALSGTPTGTEIHENAYTTVTYPIPPTPEYGAELARGACAISIAGMDTSLSKSVTLYDVLGTPSPDETTGVGHSGLDLEDLVPGNRVALKTVDAGAAATADFGTLFGDASQLPSWDGGKYSFDSGGAPYYADRFLLITWSFTDAYPEEPLDADWDEDQWQPGMPVVSRIAGVDYVYEAGDSQGEWTCSRPAEDACPGSPADAEVYEDYDRGVYWLYDSHSDAWRAQLMGAVSSVCHVVDTPHMRVAIPAAASLHLVEYGPFDHDLATPVVQATINSDTVSSVVVLNISSRWCVLRIGTPPTYDDTMYVGVSVFRQTDGQGVPVE